MSGSKGVATGGATERRRGALFGPAVCLLGALCGTSSSAPPAVTSLFPAGAARGRTAEVAAAGTFDSWPVRVWASDPAVTGTAAKEKGRLTLTVGADAVPGICWLRLSDDTGASPLRPFVVDVLPDVAEAEPNDAPAKPQPVALPAVVNGKLARNGDVDCFAVGLAKGRTLVASLEAHHGLRSPMDGVLQIVTPAGVVLEQNHDYRGLDPRIAFTAPRDGTYVVRLFAFPAEPDTGIRHFGSEACVYRLTLTAGEFVDHVTPAAVEQGREGTVTLHGWNLTEKTFRLGAGEGRATPAWAANGGVLREPHPCHDLTAAPAAGPLAPPFTATGRVDRPGHAATVPFAGTKGKPLNIRLEVEAIGSSLLPVVRVLDAAGKPLATAEPPRLHADCETTFTPPADGPYRVEVRDLDAGGGPRSVFRLRVVPPAPDFDPTVTTDRLTVTAGQPLDLPVGLGPKNGFAGELGWEDVGLPAGVTARPHPQPGKADPTKATIRFEAAGSKASGPVRLIAFPKANPKLRRPVSAKVAGFDAVTTDLWLTVVPAAKK